MAPDRLITDLTVLEVAGRTSARIAGELLARMGATVRRVDLGHATGPGMRGDDEHPIVGGRADVLGLAWDRGKTLQPEARGLDDAAALVAGADVLLTSGEAGASVLPAELHEGFAGVHAHLSPWGTTGPYAGHRGTELNAAALAGFAPYFGDADREPLAPPMMPGTYMAALAATVGVLGALQAEPATRRIDIAEYEVLATNVMSALYSLSFFHGPILRRVGRRRPNPYPYSILPCRDGWVTLVFLPKHQWQRLLAVMGNPEWASDPRLQSRRLIAERHHEEVDAHVSEWLRRYTKAELRDMATREDLPFGPLQDVDELMADRQLRHRGFLRPHEAGGRELALPGLPFTLAPAPARAPANGHAAPRRPAREANPPTGPLAGRTVLDLGWVLSGPMVTQILGDMGAEVIRVESRRHPDTLRSGLPLIPAEVDAGDAGLTPNLMPFFNNANRGKRSVIVNLRSEAGQRVLRRLVAAADVVVENLGAGSLERLGLTMEELHAIRPGLVVVRITMAGQDGPDAAIPGFAPQATALAGLDGLTGYPGEEPVGMIAGTLGDIIPALFGTAGALAAMRRAGETGVGATIDVSMLEANAMPLEPLLAARQLGGPAPVPQGNGHAVYAPHGMYRCAGEDEWISLAVRDDEEWRALCGLIGAPPEAAAMDASGRRGEQVAGWIGAWAGARGADDAFRELQAAGVPAAPALGAEQVLVDPHVTEREAVVGLEHHLMGYLPVYGSPLHGEPPMSAVHTRAPDLGEHTHEVLSELGFSEEEIAELEAGDAFDGAAARPG